MVQRFHITSDDFQLSGCEQIGVGTRRNVVTQAISRRRNIHRGSRGVSVIAAEHNKGLPEVRFVFCQNGIVTEIIVNGWDFSFCFHTSVYCFNNSRKHVSIELRNCQHRRRSILCIQDTKRKSKKV